MWGSTTPNTADECTWANAPFNNGSSNYNEAYFDSVKGTVCPNNVLAKEYDAASHIMGGEWRMPTEAEIQELIDNTIKEWTQVNGVSGYKFTSKTNTSKYIFIPAAGYCYDGSVYNVGNFGRVWSSSLNTSSPNHAWGLNFNSDNCNLSYNDRCRGWSVRGVRK